MAFNIDKARQSGWTDPEIESYLNSTGRSISTETGGFKAPLLEKFFFPTTGESERIAEKGMAARQEIPQLEENITDIQTQHQQLLAQAKQTTDPEQKKLLIDQARMISSKLGEVSQKAGKTEAGLKELGVGGKDIFGLPWSPVTQGARTAAELGAWMMPFGGEAGIPITNQATILAGKTFGKAVARGAVGGAGTGLLFGLSKKETEDLGDVAMSTAFGGAIGTATATISYGLKKAWDVITKDFPTALRETGGKMPKVLSKTEETAQRKGTFKAERAFAEKTLKENVPGNYEKMIDYGEKAEDIYETQLQKIKFKGGQTFGLDDLFPTEESKGFFVDQIEGLIDDLKIATPDQVAYKNGNKLSQAYDKLINGESNFQDVLGIKRIFAKHADFTKNVANLEGVKASRRFVADRLINFVRNDPAAPEIAKELLNKQQFAIQLQGYADTAAKKAVGLMKLSWWEISSLMAGLMGGGAVSYITKDPRWLALSVAPIALSRAFQNPAFAKGLFKIGQAGEKLPQLGPALQEFLTKGITNIATQ